MPDPPKDRWDKISAITPLITGGVVVVLMAFVKCSIDEALMERQLEVTSVTEMREILIKLRSGEVEKPEAEATALALAAFGRYAVVPLISVLQEGESVSVVAAGKALQLMALTDNQEYACSVLGRALDNQTKLFTWVTHIEIVRLLGMMDCGLQGEKILQGYRTALANDSLQEWKRRVKESHDLSDTDLKEMQGEVKKSLGFLMRSRGSRA